MTDNLNRKLQLSFNNTQVYNNCKEMRDKLHIACVPSLMYNSLKV